MLEKILISSFPATEHKFPPHTDYEYLYAQVFFGSPNKNCAGTGICKTIMPNQQDQVGFPLLQCDFAQAIVQYRSPGFLCFHFDRTTICKRSLKKHFGHNLFVVESAFVFKSPDGNFIFQVKAGVYPVEQTEKYLSVLFDQ